VFDHPDFADHERVVEVFDEGTGLKAFIAIHSSALGPAAGGCRLWRYLNSHAALGDALRLSRGMSYKNALAGLPLGGGKAVIMGPIADNRREAAFAALGGAIQALGGAYVTAEDAGVSVADMQAVALKTDFVSGLKCNDSGIGGDPSPYTARGVRRGIEAIAKHAFARNDLEGLRIAVQGLGHVGAHLCAELAARGARLLVADIDEARVDRICDTFAAARVSTDEVLLSDVDIAAPCALGGAISETVAQRMRARAIAGAANNQLSRPGVGDVLLQRNIVYAPDYVINAGGIISVAREFLGQSSEDEVRSEVARIPERLCRIFDEAEASKRPTNRIADDLARRIVADARMRTP
jgi:leucine dehydrogenase